ncbi:MAG: inositol monophosphatase [Alphaproteobacteria bacterium]|nr:inositol monophosphatase [Alphaproteobacteria bacterium]
MSPNVDQVCAFLRETAAEDIMPRYHGLTDDDIIEKNPGDLVTVADIDAERRLTRLLTEHVPGSVVVGEEGVYRNSSLLDALTGDDPVWVIDPVDGTHNFADGKPPFVTIIAYLTQGSAMGAWIHDPIHDNTAVAEQGSGAFIGSSRLSVAAGDEVSKMTGLINSSAYGRQFRDAVRAKKQAFGEIIRYGCAGHAYRELAAGHRHFSIYNRLWPWDHAAGILLHAEAGGYSARIDGASYRATDRVQGLLSAPDEATWHRIDDFLRPD